MVEVDSLLRRDYNVLVSGNLSVEKFIDMNEFGYYLCANTWILRTHDLGSPLLGNLLRASIKEVGLVSAITIAKKAADVLTRAAHCAVTLRSDEPVDVQLWDPSQESARIKEWLTRVGRLPFVLARKLLLYPKRYCPAVPKHSSALHQKAVDQFESVNRENVAHERRIASYFWYYDEVSPEDRLALPFKLVRETDLDPFVWDALVTARQIIRLIVGEFEGLSSQSFPRVGPGACRNAGPSKLERYGNMVLYGQYELSHTPRRDAGGFVFLPHPDLRERHFVRRNQAGKRKGLVRRPWTSRGYWGTGSVPQICRLSTVPKTVGDNRLIAVEDVCNQSSQLYIKDVMQDRIERKGLSKLMPIREQSVNQEMARKAAETDRYATLDLSHASDSNTKTLVQKLYPRSWWVYGFERCVPYGYILDEVDERPRPLHMLATMGCGCTFSTEDMVFFALSAASVFTVQHYWPESIEDLLTLVGEVSVMGDDIVAPTEYASTIIHVLTELGFAVNADKSFLKGRFRESCGADWVRTDDQGVILCTPRYFPRLPVGGDGRKVLHTVTNEWNSTLSDRERQSGIQRVLAMQHSAFVDGTRETHMFLTTLLQEYCPEVSTSFPYESDGTIWVDNPVRSYLYYVPDATKLNRETDRSPSVYYIDEDSARSFFKAEADQKGLTQSDADSWIACQLERARRVALTVPTIVCDQRYTGLNTGVAEILAYELQLKALDATADSILNIAISGPCSRIAELMKHRALINVRPARLSRSQLYAESYTTSYTVTTL
jgi:hypothetical protein